jgi:hypothetical protein
MISYEEATSTQSRLRDLTEFQSQFKISLLKTAKTIYAFCAIGQIKQLLIQRRSRANLSKSEFLVTFWALAKSYTPSGAE